MSKALKVSKATTKRMLQYADALEALALAVDEMGLESISVSQIRAVRGAALAGAGIEDES